MKLQLCNYCNASSYLWQRNGIDVVEGTVKHGKLEGCIPHPSYDACSALLIVPLGTYSCGSAVHGFAARFRSGGET